MSVSTSLPSQVSGEGLSYAELDRAASESAKREEDPDPQPGRGNHVRVSGSIRLHYAPTATTDPISSSKCDCGLIFRLTCIQNPLPDHWDQ